MRVQPREMKVRLFFECFSSQIYVSRIVVTHIHTRCYIPLRTHIIPPKFVIVKSRETAALLDIYIYTSYTRQMLTAVTLFIFEKLVSLYIALYIFIYTTSAKHDSQHSSSRGRVLVFSGENLHEISSAHDIHGLIKSRASPSFVFVSQ